MAIINKLFNGVMDTDSGQDFIEPMNHKYALNGRFYGTNQGLRFQNIPGNVLIQNSDLPEGQNECIGSFYDQLKQRIIWFNWNSNNYHGIYQYDVKNSVVTPLLISFVNSATDILEFSLNYPIASIVILYTTEEDGDILHWVARDNRPMKLNLKEAIDNLYGTNWLVNYLYVARQMPLIAPIGTYVDDATVNMNNMYKRLFQFRYRWVYTDDTKSTWSPYSKIPSPLNPDDIAVETDPTKNNRIDLKVTTGEADAVKIEIAFRLCLESTFSDNLFLISLDKADLSIDNNTNYIYSFFNDGSYTYIDVNEANLLFDYVPKNANTLELLNGNVIIYGGIVENYNKDVVMDVESSVSTYNNDDPSPLTYYDETVAKTYRVYFSGDPEPGDYIQIDVEDDNGDNDSFNYIVQIGDTLTDVRNALKILIDASIFTCVNATGIDGQPGLSVSHLLHFVTGQTAIILQGGGAPPEEIGTSCYRPNSRYKFGLVYFDQFGVTNGVITQSTMSIITPELDTTGETQFQIPLIEFQINHIPPIWATNFAFVRSTNLTTISNLFGVSQDTLKDTGMDVDFAYLNITNIQTNQNNLPIYDFTQGDRIRIIFAPFGGVFSEVKEFPIVDLLIDPEINGATETGNFIKIPYSTDLSDFGTGGFEHMFFEIYTPASTLSESQVLFYEFGEIYLVGDAGLPTRFHYGQSQNQVPGIDPAIFQFSRGDYYIRQRKEPITNDPSINKTFWIADRSVSDLYPSRVAGNGRAFIIDDNAKEITDKVLSRWGQAYQQGTNINQTNRFYSANFDEIDRAKGDIQIFKVWGRKLIVFQSRGVGQYGIYARFIQNNSGQQELVTTNEIITTNNINYYQGEYGLGDQYTSVVVGTNQFYFVDPVRGYQVRLSQDGLTPISELYKGQFYIRSLLTPYNKTFERITGGTAKILGVYNFFDEEYVCILQGGINGETTINNYTFSFNEKRNGYCSFYNIYPEWMVSAEDVLYSWKEGQLYVHNSDTYCNFYGKQYDCSITLVFTNPLLQKKTWISLTEVASDLFECPQIETQTTSYGSTVQQSNLIEQDFERLENQYHAAFLRDINSIGGIIDGDSLKGEYITITFTKTNASSLIYLSEISVKFVDSPLTNR